MLQFNLPDLTDLQPSSAEFAQNRFFAKIGPVQHVPYALVMNAIRLSDKALLAYKRAREALKNYNDPAVLFPGLIIQASADLETCVDCLHRAFNYLRAIRSARDGYTGLQKHIPRHVSIFTSRAQDQVRGMRNALQHFEQDLVGKRIIEGEPIATQPIEGAVELGNHRIEYNDLAIWVKRLNAIAASLAGYVEESAPAGP
jgi:hypothetical protein